MPENTIVVVSGLPRTGTSLMMKMLSAGGIPLLTDHVRAADLDNPNGYFEYERVKKLPEGDFDWLSLAQGKVVKVISALLQYMPGEHRYQVVFMRRRLAEVLQSQRQMLVNHGHLQDGKSDAEILALYEKHLLRLEMWLATQPNFETLFVDYNMLVENPQPIIQEVRLFLGNHLSDDEMLKAVDPALYRQRAV
jgi:hypothetical protein